MPASALDKSIPLKLSHQSQGNIEKKKTTVSVNLSTHIPFKWPLAWPHPRPIVARIKIENLRQLKQPRQTSALARVRSSHTQGAETNRQDRQTAQLPRIQDQACNSIATRCWQINVAAGAVCVCVWESRRVGASRSSVQLRHLLDNLVG